MRPTDRIIAIERLCRGADIGFRGDITGRFTLNNRSANLRVQGVSAAITREVAAGYTRGPFSTPPFESFVVNAISARKKNSGDVPLILDLSQPIGRAINEGVDPDQFRVTLTSVDEAIRLIFTVGRKGVQMFKAYTKDAFKLIPYGRTSGTCEAFVGKANSDNMGVLGCGGGDGPATAGSWRSFDSRGFWPPGCSLSWTHLRGHQRQRSSGRAQPERHSTFQAAATKRGGLADSGAGVSGGLPE